MPAGRNAISPVLPGCTASERRGRISVEIQTPAAGRPADQRDGRDSHLQRHDLFA